MLVGALVAVGACGGDDDDDAEAVTTPAVVTTEAATTTEPAETTTVETEPAETAPAPTYPVVALPVELGSGDTCTDENQGQTGDLGDEHLAEAVCDGGTWKFRLTEDLPRDTRLAMLECADELLGVLTSAALGGESSEPCDPAIDLLSLENDESLLFVQGLVEMCWGQAALARVNIIVDGTLASDEADATVEDLAACQTVIQDVARSDW